MEVVHFTEQVEVEVHRLSGVTLDVGCTFINHSTQVLVLVLVLVLFREMYLLTYISLCQ